MICPICKKQTKTKTHKECLREYLIMKYQDKEFKKKHRESVMEYVEWRKLKNHIQSA